MHNPLYPTIIDIEASGFGATSYPIEIGVIKPNGERYCALIAPCANWNYWCKDAEKMHGISRHLINSHGKPPIQVCTELNEFLGEITTYSDAWSHDSSWLNQLFYAACINARFRLSPIETIATEAQLLLWDETKKQIESQLKVTRHRASGDALLIQQTYLRTLQLVKENPELADLTGL